MPVTLITGGGGFIGSHLADALLAEGHHVIAVDNFVTGRRENLSHLEREPRFELIEQDACLPLSPRARVDNVLHFASPASPSAVSPIGYLRMPIATLKAGSHATMNLLELAREHGARFLLASTSEIYGDPLVTPQPEDYPGNVSPTAPRSCYDEAKRFAEAATMAYRRQYGLETRIARIFNTYGPRMRRDDGRVLPNFICQALCGKPITIYGTGQQTRSFCYVDDLVDGLLRLLKSDYADPVNLGDPDEITIEQLAHEVLELTGSSSELVYEPAPEGDPQRRQPDISLARRVLGWEPKTPRREGLLRTIEFFRNELVLAGHL